MGNPEVLKFPRIEGGLDSPLARAVETRHEAFCWQRVRDVAADAGIVPSEAAPEMKCVLGSVAGTAVFVAVLAEARAEPVAQPPTQRAEVTSEVEQERLERRAALLLAREDMNTPPPLRKMPHLAHDSVRLGLGHGYLQDRGVYHSLHLRLALHDLADATDGYPDSAAIEVLPTRFRYYVEEAKLSLEDVSVLRVMNLAPWTRYEKSISWTVRAGGTRVRDEACDGCLAGVAETGAGVSFDALDGALLGWLLGDFRLLAPVEDGLFDALRTGVGPAGGVRLRLGGAASLVSSGYLLYLPEQTPHMTWGASNSLRIHYLKDFALSFESNVQPDAWSAEAVSFIYF